MECKFQKEYFRKIKTEQAQFVGKDYRQHTRSYLERSAGSVSGFIQGLIS